MCIQVHCVECAKIRVLDPLLYWKIQPRENPYSGIFYAVVSDSRTVRIIYFCFKICSVQLLFDTAQLFFSFANSFLCTCFILLLTNWKKTIRIFHVIKYLKTFYLQKEVVSFDVGMFYFLLQILTVNSRTSMNSALLNELIYRKVI